MDEDNNAKLLAFKNGILKQNKNCVAVKEKNEKSIETISHLSKENPRLKNVIKNVSAKINQLLNIGDDNLSIKKTNIHYSIKKIPIFDEDIDLCIGLDVGTSTTKVVIKQGFTESNIFYVVDFAKYGIKGQEYLIPTYLDEVNGVFSLPKYNSHYTYTNLKLNFIEKQKNADIYFRAYIALVIQYVKNWFKEKHGNDDIVKNKKIVWQVNLGIPSAQFNDKGDNARFLKVLKEAYYLSNCPKISIKSYVAEKTKVELNIVPEIIASIQSYIKCNDISHEGLYCVSDIGAGTIDICTFRVKEDDMGNVVYSFFKSKVEKLGTQQYQAALLRYKEVLNDMVSNKEKEVLKKSIGGRIVIDNSDCLILNEIKNQQQKDIESYKNLVMTCFRSVIYRTYRNKDPNAKEWIEILPLAVGGGGIAIPFYQNIIKDDLNEWLKNSCGDHQGNKRCQGFRKIDINSNQKDFITNYSNIDCTRMAVAIGLSYPINEFDDVKRYYMECEIEDIQSLTKVDTEKFFISKDQV